MIDFGDFRGAAKRLDDIDIPRIAHTIGVGEDEIHAVIDVETGNGKGFDAQGRTKLLPEGHIFFRELTGDQRREAVRQGIAWPKWGDKPYPKDRYARLAQMIKINLIAALRSCSWGLGQVMGFNHKMAGYDTVEAMVRAFMEDEEHHLAAMVAFIKSAGLDDEIRRHDWSGFARGYNGSGYLKNRYHLKLASAFAKWRKLKDTPWTPALAENDNARIDASVDALGRGEKGDAVRALQRDLAALGFYAASIDGDFGPATEASVRAFQAAQGQLVDGWAGDATLQAITRALAAPAEPPATLESIEQHLTAIETTVAREIAAIRSAA